MLKTILGIIKMISIILIVIGIISVAFLFPVPIFQRSVSNSYSSNALQNRPTNGSSNANSFGSALVPRVQQPSSWSSEKSKTLDRFISDSMKSLEIPGVSIAIVHNGQRVYSRGFGVQSLRSGLPVTPETQFMIGSISKPLTGLMMSKLVESGIIDWSTFVSDVLPGVQVGNAALTRSIRLNHTLCACSGLPRRNMEVFFRFEGVSPEQRLSELQEMPPTCGLQQKFQYSNLAVALGGYAAAKAYAPDLDLQSAFALSMREIVFDPLQMTRSGLFPSQEGSEGFASPHAFDFFGTLNEVDLRNERAVSTIAPAGGLWSTAHDLSQYLALELNRGLNTEGTRWISEKAILARRAPITPLDETRSSFYGLGLFLGKQRGFDIIWHPGGTLGSSSYLFFMPEIKLGAVILTNQGGDNPILLAIREKLLDLVLGRGFAENPLAEQFIQDSVTARKAKFLEAREVHEMSDETASWMDTEVLGEYFCDELGSAQIRKVDSSYVAQFKDWHSEIGGITKSGTRGMFRLTGAPWGGGIFDLEFKVLGKGRLILLRVDGVLYKFWKK